MKKAILAIAIVATILVPGAGFAMTQSDQAVQDRLATLEAQVKDLQMQNQTLIANLNKAGATTNDARINGLESRVLILEKTVNLIQQNVMTVLQSVIVFLQNLPVR